MRTMLSALVMLPSPLTTNLSALCLGMGAGCLPTYLQETFSQHLKHLDIVEIEPQVVVAAVKHMGYFNRADNAKVQVHIADGDAFVNESAPSKYDVIFVDIFVGSDMPSHTATSPFFAACHTALNRYGVLAMNVHKNELLAATTENAGVVFGPDNVYKLPCGNDGNVVLLARKSQPYGRATKRHIVERCTTFSKEYGLSFDLGAHFPLWWLV